MRYLILFFSLFIFASGTLLGQSKRILMSFDLFNDESKYYDRSYFNTWRFNEFIIKGVETGILTPHKLSYTDDEYHLLTTDEFIKLLTRQVEGFEEETYRLPPHRQIQLDVTLKDSNIKKIHYVNFFDMEEPDKYLFSIKYPELAEYFYNENLVIVKNSGPFIWKGEIVHSNNNMMKSLVRDSLREVCQHPYNDCTFTRLVPDDNNELVKLEIYNVEHELQKIIHLKDFNFTEGKISNMAEVLAHNTLITDTIYTSTKLPEAVNYTLPVKEYDKLQILYLEQVQLDHEKNLWYYAPGRELSTMLIDAIDKIQKPVIFKDYQLTEPITYNEWLSAMTMEEISPDNKNVISTTRYSGRDINTITIAWKYIFNSEGTILSKEPYSLGLMIDEEISPYGLNVPVGYLSFNSATDLLKGTPGEALINEILKGNYWAYFDKTSEITVINK